MEEIKVLRKKKTLVPKLRFKDFNDSWKKGTIGDYYENLRTGMTPSRTRPDYFKGDIPWISSGELNYGYIETTTESITQDAVDSTNLKIYPPNTLFIAITGLEAPGTRGKCGMNKVPAATNQSCLAFEEIPSVSTIFLFQWYKKNGIWLYYNFAQGTKQQSFNNKLVKGFIFNIPSLPEQKKIAAFLSAVDEKIQLLNHKKQLLELYKKGIMQQLFSGKLRFKDENGKTYPKREEKKLGDVLLVKSGFGFKAQEYSNEGIKLLQIENVSYGKIKWNENTIYLPTNYLKLYQELHLKENDIVIALNRPVTNNQLKISKISKADEPSILYQRVGKLVFKKNDISHEYIYQTFTVEVKKFVLTQSIGSDQPFISINALYKLKLSLPCFEEQKKIADFLSAIDVKIESLSKQISQTQNFKKGLLQQMFV